MLSPFDFQMYIGGRHSSGAPYPVNAAHVHALSLFSRLPFIWVR